MFDLAIIGGGPAGYSAAFEAVRYNLSVCMFECDKIGGTCLNRGCVPTKYLSYVARKYQDIKKQDDGIFVKSVKIDYEKTISKMDDIVSSLRMGLNESLNKSRVEMVFGNAIIKESGVVVCNGKEYYAKKIIIATGTVANVPLVQGALTSDEVLNMDYIPERIHIIGGGAVAVEFAEIFSMLGSSVNISIRGDRILKNWDKEIANSLTQSMKKKGIIINKRCDFASMTFCDDEIVISATGRRANVPSVEGDLFDIGINGGIIVDCNYQTKTQGVFAAGDVIEGSEQLAHTAMEQGRQIVRFIVKETGIHKKTVIRCIYPYQEIASVGLTEADAKEQGIGYLVAKQTMFSNARTVISTTERGFIKIVVEKERGRILGAQLVCEHAGEIVSELAMAIDQGLTVNNMLQTVRPHPSYCESLQDVFRTMEDKINEV